jgi:hypothetical protein
MSIYGAFRKLVFLRTVKPIRSAKFDRAISAACFTSLDFDEKFRMGSSTKEKAKVHKKSPRRLALFRSSLCNASEFRADVVYHCTPGYMLGIRNERYAFPGVRCIDHTNSAGWSAVISVVMVPAGEPAT